MGLNLKNLHILIVEDITPMRELTAAVLTAQGVGKISHASDGESGFEAFCRYNPDIVMTDWQMPGVNGLELVKLIRTSSGSPNKTVPVIMMTGFGSPFRISNARDCGVTEFLVKPFCAADLSKRILHIIKHPRDFIITQSYAGPDRRRKKTEAMGDSALNLRTNPEGYKEKIKASRLLQSKVGLGILQDELLLKSQNLIDKNHFNFAPIAMMFLDQLKDALDIACHEAPPNKRSIERLVNPVMQIKANARIFKFDLLGDLANIMLNFLERVNELDKDALSIVSAHHRTLFRIVQDELKGDGGMIGKSLETELEAACQRYNNSRILRQKACLLRTLEEKTA